MRSVFFRDAVLIEDFSGDVDGQVHPYGQGHGIAGTRIDPDGGPIGLPEGQDGEIGKGVRVLGQGAQLVHHDGSDVDAGVFQDRLKQVVCEGAGKVLVIELACNCHGLTFADPDGEKPRFHRIVEKGNVLPKLYAYAVDIGLNSIRYREALGRCCGRIASTCVEAYRTAEKSKKMPEQTDGGPPFRPVDPMPG